ncbi:MAG: hypothetical protein JWL85_665 [Candidatus Saccharibacteria bacterium]|nr:hypothetical protein [Candidatus Saccharibacteria bacterium]
MTSTQYVALLRGINVGGKNLIKMTELKACFERNGFDNVASYIQSGNILFESNEKDMPKLESQIEQMLSKNFNYNARIVLRSHKQMKSVIAQAPSGFGGTPAEYRYDAIFLKDLLASHELIKVVSAKEGVDQVFAGNGVLYFSRLISRASQSKLSRIVGTPEYQHMTIRNWSTTVKLLALMEARN